MFEYGGHVFVVSLFERRYLRCDVEQHVFLCVCGGLLWCNVCVELLCAVALCERRHVHGRCRRVQLRVCVGVLRRELYGCGERCVVCEQSLSQRRYVCAVGWWLCV